jgi:hypothetical protein
MNPSMLDATTLVAAVSALLLALALMERLAARALRARNASWRQHYRRLPERATVVAEFAWNGRTWITAFLDGSHLGPEPEIHLISLAPMDEQNGAACLRWLQAEGFDQAGSSEPGDPRESFERSFPA